MDSTRACLHYLKARQLPVDRLFDQLGKALADWTEVLESVEPKVKAITPTTIHFAEKTMEAMCAYEEQIQKMDADFRNDKCFLLECGSEDAFKLLDRYAKDFEKELKVLEHNANLCAVFEFPEKIDVVRSPRFEVLRCLHAIDATRL